MILKPHSDQIEWHKYKIEVQVMCCGSNEFWVSIEGGETLQWKIIFKRFRRFGNFPIEKRRKTKSKTEKPSSSPKPLECLVYLPMPPGENPCNSVFREKIPDRGTNVSKGTKPRKEPMYLGNYTSMNDLKQSIKKNNTFTVIPQWYCGFIPDHCNKVSHTNFWVSYCV